MEGRWFSLLSCLSCVSCSLSHRTSIRLRLLGPWLTTATVHPSVPSTKLRWCPALPHPHPKGGVQVLLPAYSWLVHNIFLIHNLQFSLIAGPANSTVPGPASLIEAPAIKQGKPPYSFLDPLIKPEGRVDKSIGPLSVTWDSGGECSNWVTNPWLYSERRILQGIPRHW